MALFVKMGAFSTKREKHAWFASGLAIFRIAAGFFPDDQRAQPHWRENCSARIRSIAASSSTRSSPVLTRERSKVYLEKQLALFGSGARVDMAMQMVTAHRQAVHKHALAIRLFQDQHPGRHSWVPDRVVFGSDFGPIPYGIKEHVQIVETMVPNPAERELEFWKTSSKIFRLGLSDTGQQVIPTRPPASKAA
jgi:hypothetical protein